MFGIQYYFDVISVQVYQVLHSFSTYFNKYRNASYLNYTFKVTGTLQISGKKNLTLFNKEKKHKNFFKIF